MDDPTTKCCKKCGIEKPLTDFYARKGSTDGRRKECIACSKAWHRAYYFERPDRDQVLAYHREYSNDRYHNNPERRAYQAEWLKQRRRNSPETHLQWARTYKKRRLQRDTAYFLRERVRRHELAHRRRAAMRGGNGRYTPEQWRDLCAKYGHMCLCCGKAAKLTPDHVVPLVKGGSNDISNIQPLCLPCNQRKGTKTIDYRP